MPPDPKRRSAASHQAILKAASDLCQERGYGGVTIEAIAARAGVGKQTIYRWWPSRGAVVLDVFTDVLMQRTGVPDSRDVRADMSARVHALADVLADAKVGPHIAGLIGEAQTDRALAHELGERFVAPARAVLHGRLSQAQQEGQIDPGANIQVMADALFAPIWFRLLLTGDPITHHYADAVVEAVLGRQRDTSRRPGRPQASRLPSSGDEASGNRDATCHE